MALPEYSVDGIGSDKTVSYGGYSERGRITLAEVVAIVEKEFPGIPSDKLIINAGDDCDVLIYVKKEPLIKSNG